MCQNSAISIASLVSHTHSLVPRPILVWGLWSCCWTVTFGLGAQVGIGVVYRDTYFLSLTRQRLLNVFLYHQDIIH